MGSLTHSELCTLRNSEIAVCQPRFHYHMLLFVLLFFFLLFPNVVDVSDSCTDTETQREDDQTLRIRHTCSDMAKQKPSCCVWSLTHLDFAHKPRARPVPIWTTTANLFFLNAWIIIACEWQKILPVGQTFKQWSPAKWAGILPYVQ